MRKIILLDLIKVINITLSNDHILFVIQNNIYKTRSLIDLKIESQVTLPQKLHVYLPCCVISIFLISLRKLAP